MWGAPCCDALCFLSCQRRPGHVGPEDQKREIHHHPKVQERNDAVCCGSSRRTTKWYDPDQKQLCKRGILTHPALIYIPPEQKCCLLPLVAPLVHIRTKGTSRAFMFYYDDNWYGMKVVANSLQVNLPLIYWWDLLWVFVFAFLKTLWLNLTVWKGWRQRNGAFLVREGRPEKQRTLRPAIRASGHHLVPLRKAPKQKRSFNHHG